MAQNVSVLNPDQPKRVLLVVSNSAVSPVTGWQVGAWAAEFVHPYWEFTEHGYQVEIVSPNGGKVRSIRTATRATQARIRPTIFSASAS